MSAKPRSLVSYRLSLVLAIPLLIVVTGALIATNSYLTTRRTVTVLTGNLFRQVSEQTGNVSRAHVAQAMPAADLLAGLLRDGSLADTTELGMRFIEVLKANPGFAWVSFSDTAGTFTGAYRGPDGGLRLNRSHLAGGKTALEEHTVSEAGALTLLRSELDTGYDPRTRPFYTLAVERKKRTWTAPYVFFDQGIPGITCAEPVYARDGALRGVVTVDFDLNVLSEFVRKLSLSPHAEIFVATDDGVLLAHPKLKVVSATGQGTKGELVTKDNVADPLVRAFFAGAPKDGAEPFAFDQNGEHYLASRVRFQVDDGVTWQVGAMAPESDFMQDMEASNRFALLVSLAGVLVAVLLGAVLANRIAGPLARLSVEMEKVGQFELADTPDERSFFREIDAMERALGSMKKGLRSFASYVPRDLVRAVLASGQEAKLGGRTKELTVFFSDLAGFTTLAESLSPEKLVALLGDYLDEMTKVIGKDDGTVDKFIGDGIMAFWGAPKDEPEHALRAVEAALASKARLAEMKKAGGDVEKLHMRIGLATGDVLVGNIGARDRMNYTVMGDTANLAARLEGLNKAYGTPIMMNERAYDVVKEHILARPIDVVAVKGKAKGVRVYEPMARRADATKTQARVAELSTQALDAYLARWFDEAERLWGEVTELLPDDGAAAVMKARCHTLLATPPPADWDGVFVMTAK